MLAIAAPAAAQAQSFGPAGEADGPLWTVQWSPLADHADLRREPMGSALMLPSLLAAPGPKAGLFWTAGNPGAIPWQVEDRRAEFEAAAGEASGGYRRPQEPGNAETLRLTAGGWRPLGERGAGVGRVVVDRVGYGTARSNVARPYGSNPLTVVDTAGDALAGLRTRLEGAGGWRLGPFGLGLSAGFTAHEIRTRAASVPRLNRLAYSGATAGVVYRTGGGGFELGVHGRVQRSVEFVQLFPLLSGTNVVHRIEGFRETQPIAVGGTQRFLRHLTVEARAAGVSTGGRAGAFRWVAMGEVARHEDVHQPHLESDAPLDTWDADLITARAALQGPILGLDATLQAGWAGLEGSARLDEFDDVTHTGDHTRGYLDAELRRGFGAGDWRAAVRWRTERQIRAGYDRVERVGSEIRSWTHAISGEVARGITEGVDVAAGAGFGGYSPGGFVPYTAEMGPVYERFIGPGLYLDGTSATFSALSLTGRWQATDGALVVLDLRRTGASPNPGDFSPELLPEGERGEWRVGLSVVLR